MNNILTITNAQRKEIRKTENRLFKKNFNMVIQQAKPLGYRHKIKLFWLMFSDGQKHEIITHSAIIGLFLLFVFVLYLNAPK